MSSTRSCSACCSTTASNGQETAPAERQEAK
jgi:hypothetical protein